MNLDWRTYAWRTIRWSENNVALYYTFTRDPSKTHTAGETQIAENLMEELNIFSVKKLERILK